MSDPKTITDGGLETLDPSDVRVFVFDWDVLANLAEGVTITTPTFTVTAIKPSNATVLTKDNEGLMSGSRRTTLRLTVPAGVLGAMYRVANKVVTNETPAQTKERSFYVQIVER